MMKKKLLAFVTVAVAIFGLAACSSKSSNNSSHSYTVGITGSADQKIWDEVTKQVKADGITIKTKLFTDYTQANPAVQEGDLSLNAFQHEAFLNNWNKQNNGSLVTIGVTYISPFGLYSKKITNYQDLKDGDTVAIPNDVTNGGRALQLLAAIGVITLKSNAPSSPQLTDIAKYDKKITIKELQADQIVAALPDVTAACINTNFVHDQLHTTPEKSAIYIDTDHLEKVNEIYKNVIAVKKENQDNPDFKKIVAAYHTAEVAKLVKANDNIPAW